MIKKIYLKTFGVLCFFLTFNINASETMQYGLPSRTLINQIDINNANKKAINREIMTNGIEKIVAYVSQQKLAPNTWAVVFNLDGTLLDDYKNSTPGAVQLTCKIINLGGVVSIVTDRSGSIANNTDFISYTKNDLDSRGICYSNILFANNNNDINKNPRFTALATGDYEHVLTTQKLPPLKIVGYFGSKIEDFPDLKQNLANELPISDAMFSQFGQRYFMLPR